MNPTLLIGDHFYTNSAAYRFGLPERGDVAVFRVAREGTAIHPADRRPDLPREMFVKRIVGLPGDTIELNGAVLRVNGSTVTGPLLDESFTVYDGSRLPLRNEGLGPRSYQVIDDPSRSSSPVQFIVESDRYFFAGDNRLNSKDSRYRGTVDRDDILGRVSSIYWDFNGTWLEFASPARWFELLRDRPRTSRDSSSRTLI
jgi:signal peptidase I